MAGSDLAAREKGYKSYEHMRYELRKQRARDMQLEINRLRKAVDVLYSHILDRHRLDCTVCYVLTQDL